LSALAVLGTSSWAGKSLLTTALCRWFARHAVAVAPFKAQNMSNNARVVEGGEIGTAQYLQALACGLEPALRFNPVLVKPEADQRSQVVVNGRVQHALSQLPWRERPPALAPAVDDALRSLLDEFELVLIEGAGSPAEINLFETDVANLYAVRQARATAIVVADIARGGAFAHLFGTWALTPDDIRARVGGFVLNRFRGDLELLTPGPRELERRTGVPTLGILPELDHGLPDEDGVARRRSGTGQRVAIVTYPAASNLDEFRQLEEAAEVIWASRPADLAAADLIVLPGSKEPLSDLAWVRATGLGQAITGAASAGRRLLGICGGLQMLGETVSGQPGLGLLPLATTFTKEKTTLHRVADFTELPEPWRPLSGKTIAGYEIRQGRTTATGPVDAALGAGLAFTRDSVLGLYLHGLFEVPEIVEALVGRRPARSLDAVFDALADAVDEHLDGARLRALARLAPTQIAPDPVRREEPAPRSLVIVNTGDGKGKSTAAFGVLLRGVARRGWRCCVIQFVKSGRWKIGEEETARRLGVDWLKGGDGFSWESRDLATSAERARDAWVQARAAIEGDEYQLVVLDEITYAINWGWIDGEEVASVLRARAERVNVIATGRHAPPELIAVADTVTEMVKVRHAYDRGIKARRGLDF
jgi:adenosylcobyric acid synthase